MKSIDNIRQDYLDSCDLSYIPEIIEIPLYEEKESPKNSDSIKATPHKNFLSKQDPKFGRDFPDVKLIPSVIMLKRVSIRVFPNKQKIALYYSDALDTYITVPFGENVTSLNEEMMADVIKQLEESRKREDYDKERRLAKHIDTALSYGREADDDSDQSLDAAARRARATHLRDETLRKIDKHHGETIGASARGAVYQQTINRQKEIDRRKERSDNLKNMRFDSPGDIGYQAGRAVGSVIRGIGRTIGNAARAGYDAYKEHKAAEKNMAKNISANKTKKKIIPATGPIVPTSRPLEINETTLKLKLKPKKMKTPFKEVKISKQKIPFKKMKNPAAKLKIKQIVSEKYNYQQMDELAPAIVSGLVAAGRIAGTVARSSTAKTAAASADKIKHGVKKIVGKLGKLKTTLAASAGAAVGANNSSAPNRPSTDTTTISKPVDQHQFFKKDLNLSNSFSQKTQRQGSFNSPTQEIQYRQSFIKELKDFMAGRHSAEFIIGEEKVIINRNTAKSILKTFSLLNEDNQNNYIDLLRKDKESFDRAVEFTIEVNK